MALDCLFSSFLALQLNLISEDKLLRIYKLANSLGLPLNHKDFTNNQLINFSLDETKAHRNGNLNLPITSELAQYIFINELSNEAIEKTINLFQSMKDKL